MKFSRLKREEIILKHLKTLLIVSAIFFSGIFITGVILHTISKSLPSHKHLASYVPPMGTRIYSADGALFAEYATERRIFLPLQEIPELVTNAFLAVEDSHFYSHSGIHIPSIIRAFFHNIQNIFARTKSRLNGGSTITQQVAKNFLLSNERTYTRKIKEAILAIRLEQALSKNRILELYLNEIYLGSGVYGVAASSLLYFDKALPDLELHEIAFLATLPKAPENYHPQRNPKNAIFRRNWVLDRMCQDGYITEEQAKEAAKKPLGAKTQRAVLTIDANYFAEHVRQHLIDIYNRADFYEGGLYVRSSMDAELQKLADKVLHEGIQKRDKILGFRGPITNIPIADWHKHLTAMKTIKGLYQQELAVVTAVSETAITVGLADGKLYPLPFQNMKWAKRFYIDKTTKEPLTGPAPQNPSDITRQGDVIVVSRDSKNELHLDQIPELNGALIAIEPYSGRVLAFDGGYRFSRSQFNRATQALRQVGSTLKPFVYLAGLEAGLNPSTTILDSPLVIGDWKPQNITGKFYGRNTLRRSLERSLNLASIRVAMRVGMQRVVNMVKRLKIYDDMDLSLVNVLGAKETTLLKLTTAFSMIANGGKFIEPTFIDRVQDRYGNTLIAQSSVKLKETQTDAKWQQQFAPKIVDLRQQVIRPENAYQVTSMLEGVVSRGSGRRAHIPGVQLAGKTGTSNDNRDAIFIGFNSKIVVGVFVGFDKPQSLGSASTGGRVAGPIFKAFMEEYLKRYEVAPFPVPEGIKFIAVDLNSGQPDPQSTNTILEAFVKEDSDTSFSNIKEKDNDDVSQGIY